MSLLAGTRSRHPVGRAWRAVRQDERRRPRGRVLDHRVHRNARDFDVGVTSVEHPRAAIPLVDLDLPVLDLHDRWPWVDVPARVETVRHDRLDDLLAHGVGVLNNRARDGAHRNADPESGTPERENSEDEPPFGTQLPHICLLSAVGRVETLAAEDGNSVPQKHVCYKKPSGALPSVAAGMSANAARDGDA
jgi:hypothetical protein